MKPFQPFTSEYEAKDRPGSKYFRMTILDILIAAVFIGLFTALPFLIRGA